MFKGALRSDQEWEAFHTLIETLGDEDVDRAADDSRSRRLILETPKKERPVSSEVRAPPEGLARASAETPTAGDIGETGLKCSKPARVREAGGASSSRALGGHNATKRPLRPLVVKMTR